MAVHGGRHSLAWPARPTGLAWRLELLAGKRDVVVACKVLVENGRRGRRSSSGCSRRQSQQAGGQRDNRQRMGEHWAYLMLQAHARRCQSAPVCACLRPSAPVSRPSVSPAAPLLSRFLARSWGAAPGTSTALLHCPQAHHHSHDHDSDHDHDHYPDPLPPPSTRSHALAAGVTLNRAGPGDGRRVSAAIGCAPRLSPSPIDGWRWLRWQPRLLLCPALLCLTLDRLSPRRRRCLASALLRPPAMGDGL